MSTFRPGTSAFGYEEGADDFKALSGICWIFRVYREVTGFPVVGAFVVHREAMQGRVYPEANSGDVDGGVPHAEEVAHFPQHHGQRRVKVDLQLRESLRCLRPSRLSRALRVLLSTTRYSTIDRFVC